MVQFRDIHDVSESQESYLCRRCEVEVAPNDLDDSGFFCRTCSREIEEEESDIVDTYLGE